MLASRQAQDSSFAIVSGIWNLSHRQISCMASQLNISIPFRWQSTTPQWPIMSAMLHGVSRDQLMACHKANHIQVVYAPLRRDSG